MSRYRFIAAEKAAVRNVKKTCTLLSVSRSAFYQSLHSEPSRHEQRDIELEERIEAVHEGSRRTYGAPRVHQRLRRDGIRTGKKRVARLMAGRGLAGRHRRRFKKTTIADERAVASPDLVKRGFAAGRGLDDTWVGDITYLRTWEGWPTWPPSSTSAAGESWASPSPTTCAAAWSKRRWRWQC